MAAYLRILANLTVILNILQFCLGVQKTIWIPMKTNNNDVINKSDSFIQSGRTWNSLNNSSYLTITKSLSDEIEVSTQVANDKHNFLKHHLIHGPVDQRIIPRSSTMSMNFPEYSSLVPFSGKRRMDVGNEDTLVYQDIYLKPPQPFRNKFTLQRQNIQRFSQHNIPTHSWQPNNRNKPSIIGSKYHVLVPDLSWSGSKHRFNPYARNSRHSSRSARQQDTLGNGNEANRPTDVRDFSLFLRSMLGVTANCVSSDNTFSCTLTPFCWMRGGAPISGCNSIFFTCCIFPSAPREERALEGRSFSSKRRLTKKPRPPMVSSDLSKIVNEPECGQTKHKSFSKRIIGGTKAKFAELPWQVHIRISSFQCGGVLLNKWFVATAAHCVHRAKLSQITVYLGEYDTKNTEAIDEPLNSESFKVDYILLHPEFRYMLTQPDRFDIALLRLSKPVVYRENIIPICLPTEISPLADKIGVVAGWGKTDNSLGKTGTNLLHKVKVPIIEDNFKCRIWHTDKDIAVQLHDEMFCAGHQGGKMDACLGDSGGPLVIKLKNRWTLIGITSAGFGCAVDKQPGIYHKVTTTANWIARNIAYSDGDADLRRPGKHLKKIRRKIYTP